MNRSVTYKRPCNSIFRSMAQEKSLRMAPTSPKIVRTISSLHAAGSCLSSSVSSSISFELARRAGVFTNPLFLRPKRR